MEDQHTYTRDELLNALAVVSQFLQGLPGSMTLTGQQLRDGMVNAPLGDQPAVSSQGHPKGVPQPPRKTYIAVPKTRRGSTDDLPRAARRIADLVLGADGPLTSHDIMRVLQMARPTFANAMSVLLKRKIVQASPLREG